MNWSSGKDSALALYKVQKKNEYNIQKLFTTLDASSERVSMHQVKKELLFEQAEKMNIDIQIADISTRTSMEDYNQQMEKEIAILKKEGLSASIFGDIFLEDLKKYREDQLSKMDVEVVFPLWKKETSELIQQFIELGFKAIVVCTNSRYLHDDFCGRILNKKFVADLPEEVDPCGENGEFHTFVFDGPIFNQPVNYKIGQKSKQSFPSKDGKWDSEFCYLDLLPGA